MWNELCKEKIMLSTILRLVICVNTWANTNADGKSWIVCKTSVFQLFWWTSSSFLPAVSRDCLSDCKLDFLASTDEIFLSNFSIVVVGIIKCTQKRCHCVTLLSRAASRSPACSSEPANYIWQSVIGEHTIYNTSVRFDKTLIMNESTPEKGDQH